jgi:AraC-like DNA-binding protein
LCRPPHQRFTDLSHFNRTFRRRFGSTPSDVRARAQRTDE